MHGPAPWVVAVVCLACAARCTPLVDAPTPKNDDADGAASGPTGADADPDPDDGTASDVRSAFSRIEAESFDSQQGFVVEGGALGYSSNGDYAVYRHIDFGPDGAQSLRLRWGVPDTSAGRILEVHLGSPQGELIASVAAVSSGGFRVFSDQAAPLARRVTGVQDVVLVCRADDLADIDAFTFAATPASPPPTEGGAARWFPGHYLQATDAVNRSGMDMGKRSLIQDDPNFIGYQVSLFWGQTETAQDDYSALERQLTDAVDAARADGKKLWLRVFERSFHGTTRPRPFPHYISDAGGDFLSSGSQNIWAPKVWEPFVKERFLRWAEKVAEFTSAHPEVVLISSEEYTIQGAWEQPGYSGEAVDQLWRDFAARVGPKAAPCLVHVNTGWSTVYPPDFPRDRHTLDRLLEAYKVGLGPTDLRRDTTEGSATLSTNFGSFMFNRPTDPQPGFQGQAFFALQYEWPDYNSTESPLAHLHWAYDVLQVHYLAWDPDPGPGTGMPWSWNDAQAAVDSTDGLIRTAKPSWVP